MAFSDAFQAHLQTGHTTLARCWVVTRRDGKVLGFTDHDRDLAFEGISFRASTGMSARALQQTSGLAVDNTEAMGVLSSAAITEEDIEAGRYDGAKVRAWLVNWAEPDQRVLQFNGSIGEISRGDGEFNAELRGQTEALNQPQGRVYQAPCSAVLGDGNCRFSFDLPGYVAEVPVEVVEEGRVFRFADLTGFDHRWFERGRLQVLSGAAQDLVGMIKNDRLSGTERVVELWDRLRSPIETGDMIRLEAGCDKRAETCRLKFNNFLNFRGFPHIPGEDWLTAYPTQTSVNDGASLTIGGARE